MYKLEIHKKAKEALDFLKNQDKQTLQKIIDALDELVEKGLYASNIKNIGESIFRKRVGRYRILFSFDIKEKNKIHIWIIELEKDTKKDYKKWKNYIKKYIKDSLF